ncbi:MULTISPECIES: hypothetical protein [unclassified Polynucleobacter]|uniref:hypothetical protein n=1 Tax=unclassified Polynucleobacter TaxID=2640945 RepID=UPI001C0E68A3|nr:MULTISPECIES: hypothetical protein [unclassified Polynucleobacter]MBU3602932.1 hypothetical protein [Polynucleobacter sp. AP-Kaivos-20-H2]MBU3619889.1 hypothetical protein [Polynucleobacter sp. JS-Fieb-80-E5]
MHLFSENLAVEISSYYRNLALGHGVVPKVFTLVNSEGDQYLFFIDDLPMKSDDEQNQFLAYIVQAHEAVCYARGTLVIVEKNQQFIEFAVIDRDDAEAIVCSAQLTRDIDDKPISLGEFDKTLVKKGSIIFGGLFEPIQLSEDKTEDFESLWVEMKSKILHRSMGL